jgi:hypothetical protein
MCIVFIHTYECGHIESSSMHLCHLPDCKGEEPVYIDEKGHCTLIFEEPRLEKGENISITEFAPPLYDREYDSRDQTGVGVGGGIGSSATG